MAKIKQDVSSVVRGDQSQIEIMGNSRLTVEGCLGVEEYRPETVKLKFKSFSLRIFGENLVLSNLHGGFFLGGGRVFRVVFDFEGGGWK